MRYYPVFLDLVDQPCIVLGEGQFAREKTAALREAGASVRVIPSHEYRDGDLAGARLVVDASEDPEVNRRSWDEAERAGILINVVDRPAQCRFIAPAIVRRDPVVIAISTSGESPFLASALRARLERWLGKEWGPFTALVGRIRRDLRAREVSLAEQTRVYRRLLSSDVRLLLREGKTEQAQREAAVLTFNASGRVALVGAGPGDGDLITVKGRDMLADADYVLYDALISAQTLAACGPQAKLEAVGKRGGEKSTPQEDITGRMIELARAGNIVVRLKGGDPFVFGRGGEELRDLTAAGVDVLVVPGVSSAFAAAASIGIPATMRGLSSSIAITTAQGSDWRSRLRALALASDTLIVMMVRTNLAEVSAEISCALGRSTASALVSNATLPGQRSLVGPISEIAMRADAVQMEAPATLIVGEVVSQLAHSDLERIAL